MALTLAPDFKDFLRLLNEKQVEYLIVGGYAVGYYGYPRATGDLDIWVAIHPTNAEKLVDVLKEFGFNVPELDKALFLKEDSIVRLGYPPVRLELMTTISGVEFEDCYHARREDVIDGVHVNLLNLYHLKLNKRASGRNRDLDDLANLP